MALSDKHAPVKTARLKKHSNPWITPEIIALMYKRDYVHKHAVESDDSSMMNQYRCLRNKVTSLINYHKKKYFEEVN